MPARVDLRGTLGDVGVSLRPGHVNGDSNDTWRFVLVNLRHFRQYAWVARLVPAATAAFATGSTWASRINIWN
jgi:hypothetical protein